MTVQPNAAWVLFEKTTKIIPVFVIFQKISRKGSSEESINAQKRDKAKRFVPGLWFLSVELFFIIA
jgi:hypothetical protein